MTNMTALRSRVTVVAVAAVVGGALGVAGCGSSDTDTYKKQVTQAAKQFQTDAQAAGTSLSASQSAAEFKTAATKFKAAVTTFTGKLSSLKPPSSAKDEQDQLVADLKHFSGTVNEISDRVSNVTSSNVEGLVSLVPQLQSDVQKVSADAKNLENAVNKS
jgi:outer membrane murein-binding lipoprotein Lpp